MLDLIMNYGKLQSSTSAKIDSLTALSNEESRGYGGIDEAPDGHSEFLEIRSQGIADLEQ